MSKKIFIIEDDFNVLSSLEAKFRIAGIEVQASDGMEEIINILQKIIQYKPNYIILDLILPYIDGFELLSAIKANEYEHRTPVIVFTDLSDEDSQVRCEKLGANYYFVKNELNVDDFVKKIKKIIANREKIAD